MRRNMYGFRVPGVDETDLVECPVCHAFGKIEKRGPTLAGRMTEGNSAVDGYLIRHPGRKFPCRMPDDYAEGLDMVNAIVNLPPYMP